MQPSYNVAPTQQVMVARELDGRLEGVAMRWGLIPSWAKDKKMAQINARADTAVTKPMFRSAFKKRRCLILADGYYEWKATSGGKQPYYHRLADGRPFVFAGLWETWRDPSAGTDAEPLITCAVLTTDANELAGQVHDRMPVILDGADAIAWIDPEIEDAEMLTAMLRPFPAEQMTAFPVGTTVGNVRNNCPACIEPVTE